MSTQPCWYLFPGQTMESTKVEERGKALLVTGEGWKHLTSHLYVHQKQEELLHEEAARREYIKQGSYNMTKNWDNSIEKIRARRLEEHEAKLKRTKEERVANFMALRAEQEKERQKYIETVKKTIFLMEEKPRNLNTALLLGEVMHERKLQNEFDARQRERKRLNEEKYAKFIKEEAEKEKQRNLEKERTRRQANIENAAVVMEQIKQREWEDKNIRGKEKEAEALDLKIMEEEYQALKKYEQQLEWEKKMKNREILYETRETQEKLRTEQENNDKAFDKINDIYARAKCRIERLRREKIKEIQNNRFKLQEHVAKKIVEGMIDKSEQERLYYENGKQDIENRELERKEKEDQRKKELIKERIDARKEYLERVEKQKAIKGEMDGFIFLSRLKAAECTQVHEGEKVVDNTEKKRRYAEELREQMKEKRLLKVGDKDMEKAEVKYYEQKFADKDKKFFAYGDEVYNLAKDFGRPTLPIERVIEKYKIENGLKRKKKIISQLVSNVPIDNPKDAQSADSPNKTDTPELKDRCECKLENV